MTGIVLIGCGAVSRLYYAPALKELERSQEVRVIGLMDPDTSALKTLGDAFPSAVHLHDLDSLGHSGADLAIVASPPRFHAEQTIRSLRAGMSVLCEKPMAVTVEEGEAMIDAAATAGRVLAVGHIRRFLPAAQVIRSVLADGILGDVVSFTGFEGGNFRWPVAAGAYFTRAQSAGGVLLDLGSHALDLVLWWFGEPEEVMYEDDAMGGVEVNCRVRMRLPHGVDGQLRLTREWARPNEYVIRCSGGWLRWTVNEAEAVQMGFSSSGYVLDARLRMDCGENRLPRSVPVPTFESGFVEQIRNVAAAHLGRTTPLVPGDEGLRNLKLIDRCYRLRTIMDMPWLTKSESDQARRLAAQT